MKEYRRKNFSKSFLLSLLEQAEKERRMILFYCRCGACGKPARFEYEHREYLFAHNAPNCFYNKQFNGREEFIDSLLANRNAIYSVVYDPAF